MQSIWASENGYLQNVQKLLRDNRVNPSANDNNAIRWASKGHSGVVKELLKESVDPSANHDYAIRYASNYRHLKVVEELLKDNRVDPSANDNYAIQWAS